MKSSAQGLGQLDIEDRYMTYEGPSPVKHFFVPCLEKSIKYDRAAGFFTSGALSQLVSGLETFRRQNGKMRLITSPRLTEADVQQIENGYDLRRLMQERMDDTFNECGKDVPDTLGYLGKLIADQTLDIRIALINSPEIAMFHEKWGIFDDAYGNSCYFSGSNNETVNAQFYNAESFDTWVSWDGEAPQRKIKKSKELFERLWNSETPNLQVVELSEVSREMLAKYAQKVPADYVPRIEDETESEIQTSSEKLTLRSYQQEAVDAWLSKDGRGILKMATGTGKTITAIGAINQLIESGQPNGPLLVLITCPLKNLVEQWDRDLRKGEFQRVLCYENINDWFNKAQRNLNELSRAASGALVLVTTHATWSRNDLRGLVASWKGELLVVSDEVHHMGSRKRLPTLPKNAKFVLGLSATPERHNDVTGTEELFSYFGGVVYELSMKKAIELKCLSPYRYVPIRVYLTEEETSEYSRISGELAAILAKNGGVLDDDDDDFTRFMQLIRVRNALLGSCDSKTSSFQNQAKIRKDLDYQLVFCSEGKGLDQDEKQLTEVVKILGHELELGARKYVSETPPGERIKILKAFSEKTLKFVVSMRCLDEGVDLPDARIAYLLASSTDPRQWVQRRGRILRLPRDGKVKQAEIIDFVTVPDTSSTLNESVKALVLSEVKRVMEFGEDSINNEEASAFAEKLMEEFNLESHD